jgi:hypothetical protein
MNYRLQIITRIVKNKMKKQPIKTISSLPEHDMVRAFFLDGLGHASRFLLFTGIASFGVAGDFFKSLFTGDAA